MHITHMCTLTHLNLAPRSGAWLGLPSLFNTGTTFLCLYLSEKSVEVVIRSKLFWVGVLGASCGMCGAAWWLHEHPDWILSMLTV